MARSALAPAEKRFLRALKKLDVRFMLVGMSAALVQGARGATDDVDLWFEDMADPGIAKAAKQVGGFYVPGGLGMRPPLLAGDVLGDRFDVVTHLDGIGSFADEWRNTTEVDVDGIKLRVLRLERIVASKRAAGRAKDTAQIPALEEAIALLSPKRRRRSPQKRSRKK